MSNSYMYPYASSFPASCGDGEYNGHGDGFGQYYGMASSVTIPEDRRRAKQAKQIEDKHSRASSLSRSRSKTRSRSVSRSRSDSSYSRSSVHDIKKIKCTEPKFSDAFRILTLTPSKSKKNSTKYLATKKKQDHVHELLKRDGLGSKHWFFYPRTKNIKDKVSEEPEPRADCDKRIKVDGDFFRKCKKSKNLDTSAPIAKLKTWELIFYKELGFIRAV